MVRTVLVSGVSGIVGQGIVRSLRQSGRKLRVVGCALTAQTAAAHWCDALETVPRTTDPAYWDALANIVRKYDVEMAIPGIELDVYTWNEHCGFFDAHGVRALLNSPELISLCRDKWAFYQVVADLPYTIFSCLYAPFDVLAEKLGVPFLAKPRSGSASRGIKRITDKAFFERAYDAAQPVLFQPIIGSDDEEYTVSGFFDDKHRLLAYFPLKRTLSNEGFTQTAKTCALPEAQTALQTLGAALKAVGPTNFQFRKDARGQLKLLEINPRISSATSIRAAFGYNEAALSVIYFLEKQPLPALTLRRGTAVRYTEDGILYAE